MIYSEDYSSRLACGTITSFIDGTEDANGNPTGLQSTYRERDLTLDSGIDDLSRNDLRQRQPSNAVHHADPVPSGRQHRLRSLSTSHHTCSVARRRSRPSPPIGRPDRVERERGLHATVCSGDVV